MNIYVIGITSTLSERILLRYGRIRVISFVNVEVNILCFLLCQKIKKQKDKEHIQSFK